MKFIALGLLSVGIIAVLNSCCTKVACLGADDLATIDLHGFSQSNLDTITIIRYERSSSFTHVIDSINTHAYPHGDHFSAPTGSNVNTELDYKIKLISTGQVFTLTAFETKKEGCNSCFPYRPESDYYKKLIAYQVNGQRMEGSQIIVYN